MHDQAHENRVRSKVMNVNPGLKMIPIIRWDKDLQLVNEMTIDFSTSFQKDFYADLFPTNLMTLFSHDLGKRLF